MQTSYTMNRVNSIGSKISNYLSETTSLDLASRNKVNNLNAIRLVAALLVIVDHAFPLEGVEHFLAPRLGFTIGKLCVATFFFISGILITQSWMNDPNLGRFIAKRVLRIFPGLIIAIAVCTFVVGPLFTTLNLHDYFTNKLTYDYFFNNLTLYRQRYLLPKVFETNLYPGAVNGSLWTLPLEISAYILVLFFGVTKLLKNKFVILGTTFALVYVIMRWFPVGKWLDGLFILMPRGLFIEFLFIFALGALAYLFREKIVLNNFAAAVSLAMFLLTLGTTQSSWGLYFGWSYFILTVGYSNWKICQWVTKPGDLSYGIYIYAFPIQQIVSKYLLESHNNHSPWLNVIISMIVVYPISYLSWRFIEKPALKLRPRRKVAV